MTYATILKIILEMSVTASILALVVMIIRKAAKRALPKSCIFALWIVVIAKLLIPLSLPSPTSLYNIIDVDEMPFEEVTDNDLPEALPDVSVDPVVKPTVPQINVEQHAPNGGEEVITPENPTVTPIIPENDAQINDAPVVESNGQEIYANAEEISAETARSVFETAGAVYCGITAVVAVTIISIYAFTAYRIGKSETVEDERILGIIKDIKSDARIQLKLLGGNRSIMIFGILHPTIILPEDYDTLDERELKYLLMHELEHCRHKDTLWNLIMLAAVCVHWFNPIVWLSYRMFLSDMETACDARVLGKLPDTEKHSFASVLLTFASRSIKGNTIATMGFGKKNIKDRLVSIIKFKKTGAIAIAVSVLVLVIIVSVFATSAFNKGEDVLDETVTAETTEALTSVTTEENTTGSEETEEGSESETEETAPEESETVETELETESEAETVIDVVVTEPDPIVTPPAVETESEQKVETTEEKKTTAAPPVPEPEPEVVPNISYAVSQKPLLDVNEDVISYLWKRAANKDMANVQGQSPVWVIDNRVDCRVLTTMCGSNGLKIAEDMSGYYNSDFFEENVLYMIYVHTSNDTNVCAVDSVYFDGKELNINLTTEYSVYLGGEMANKEEADWFVCVEVNREAFEYAETFNVSSSQDLVVYDYDYKNDSYSRIDYVGFYPCNTSNNVLDSTITKYFWGIASNSPENSSDPVVVIDSYDKYIQFMLDKNEHSEIRYHLARIIDESFFVDNVLLMTCVTTNTTSCDLVYYKEVLGDTLKLTTKMYVSGDMQLTVLGHTVFFDSIDRETYEKIKYIETTLENMDDKRWHLY